MLREPTHKENFNMDETMQEERKLAARKSRGTSADSIYRLVSGKAQELQVSGTVFDFGAGTGNFARILCENPNITSVIATDIVDYGENYQDSKLEWVFHDLNDNVALNSETVDAIFAVEVIEHLENPRHLAREWFRVLKPGGHILVSTPNNESWRALLSLIVKSHFSAFTGASYPAHITALLRLDIERIFAEAGFSQITFYYTDHGLIPKVAERTWQASSGGLLKGLRYSDNLLCVATKVPLSPT
jgi:2-polyprenyl-3-methyl-5-hydroxy-6-metoxy-1,4-benzoquinol methylase